jgi:hypothetical protein
MVLVMYILRDKKWLTIHLKPSQIAFILWEINWLCITRLSMTTLPLIDIYYEYLHNFAFGAINFSLTNASKAFPFTVQLVM